MPIFIANYPLSDISQFRKTLRKRDKVAVEATGNTRYFIKQIQDRVEEVQVADPGKYDMVRRSLEKQTKMIGYLRTSQTLFMPRLRVRLIKFWSGLLS